MRKSLLTAAAVAMTMTAAASRDFLPAQIYVVGDINNWMTPDTEAGRQYKLLDDDGDGIYEGTFDFAQVYGGQWLQMKFFLSECGWNDASQYLSLAYNETGSYLYSNRPFSAVMMRTDNSFNYNNNLTIDNWMGGELTIRIDLSNYDHAPEANDSFPVTLAAPGQPKMPDLPASIYVIGDFNEWQVPQGNDLKGAVAVPEAAAPLFWSAVELPADGSQFKVYVPASPDADAYYLGTDLPPFTIMQPTTLGVTATKGAALSDVEPFRITNWKGGRFGLEVNVDDFHISIYGNGYESLPAYEPPTADGIVYAVISNGTEVSVQPYNALAGTVFISSEMQGQELTITLSTVESATPAPEQCWGASEDFTLAMTEGEESEIAMTRFVKGGKPYRFTFLENGEAYLFLNFLTGIAEASAYERPLTTSLECIYLVGQPQGWDINSDAMKLGKVDDNVFENTFYIAPGAAMFRFYTTLGSWDSGSIGSEEGGRTIDFQFSIDKSIPVETPCMQGQGNWNFPEWTGGMIRMRVDLNTMTAQFYDVTDAGVDGISVEAGEAPVYFNLQGVRVDAPRGGIFIKVQSGKVSKVAL